MSVHKLCPKCQTPADLLAPQCLSCGHVYRTQFAAPDQTQVVNLPPRDTPPPPYAAPPPYPPYPQYPPQPAVPYTGKERVPAGLLAILLGPFGAHLFYLGHTGWAIGFLVSTLLTCGYGGLITGVIGLIQGILYLCANDYEFQQKYVIEKRFF